MKGNKALFRNPTYLRRETKTGLLDTSVVIDLDGVAPGDLPEQTSISAITMAELSAGPHATADPAERARRQDRLQQLESWVP